MNFKVPFINSKKNKSEQMTVQDLLAFDEITDQGIVRVDNTYIALLECGNINIHLLDDAENSIVWNNFRAMLNSLNIRYSMILQSHFFDVTDFVNDYEERANGLTNLTPELHFSKEDVIKGYYKFTEERNRDQRGYYIFRYNPNSEGHELALVTGNVMVDSMLKKTKSKTAEYDDEESRGLAISMLEEVSDLAYQMLRKLNIPSVRLNRIGILNMVYGTLNRDLTIAQRLQDTSAAHSYTEFKVSETPEIINGLLNNYSSDDEELFKEYFAQLEKNNPTEELEKEDENGEVTV